MSDNVDVSATVTVNDRASAPIGQIQAKLGQMAQTAQRLGSRMVSPFKGLAQSLRGVGASFGRLGASMRGLLLPFGALFGLGAGVGIAKGVQGIQSYVDRVRDLSRTAPLLGTTTEQLNAMHYAAQRSGVSAEQFNSAMTRGNRVLRAAATGGNKQVANLFDRLGISLKDAQGNIRPMVDLLPELAAAMQRQTDPTLKGAIATALFGRGMEGMMGMLSGGPEVWARYLAAAEKFSPLTKEQEEQALAFRRAQGRIAGGFDALGLAITQRVIPHLTPLAEGFANFLDRNHETIVGGMTSAFRAMNEVMVDLKGAFSLVGDVLGWLFGKLDQVVKATIGWEPILWLLKPALAGLATIITAGIVIALSAMAVAAWAAMAPFAPLLLGLGALGAAAYILYKYWDQLPELFGGLWAKVKAGFDAVVEWLGPWGNLFAPILIYKNWDAIVAWFGDLWERVKGPFNAMVDWLGPWGNIFLPLAIYKNWEGITQFFSRLWAGDVKGAFDGVSEWFGPWGNLFLPLAIYNNWESIKQWFADLWADPEATFNRALVWLGAFIGRFIPQPVLDAWGGVQSFFSDLLGGVERAFQRAWAIIEPIVEALRRAIGWITDNMPSLGGIGERLAGAGSWLWNAPGRALDNLTGVAAPATVAQVPYQAAAAAGTAAETAATQQPIKADMKVSFENAPPGMRVSTVDERGIDVSTDVGYSMATP